MTPDFVNTNYHDAYVVDPERQDKATSEASGLLRIGPHATVSATGTLADRIESTPGIVKTSSKEGKAFLKKGGQRDEFELLTAGPGPATFPVPEEERTAERSGLHITGRDSGVPVASEEEPGDVKDGTGADPYKGIAAVEQGEVERGDVPKAVQEEPSVETPGNLTELSRDELRKLAKARNVERYTKLSKTELVAALEAPRAEGGGGGVSVQTEGASKTEQSEAVASPGSTGTLTTDKDPTTKRKG